MKYLDVDFFEKIDVELRICDDAKILACKMTFAPAHSYFKFYLSHFTNLPSLSTTTFFNLHFSSHFVYLLDLQLVFLHHTSSFTLICINTSLFNQNIKMIKISM